MPGLRHGGDAGGHKRLIAAMLLALLAAGCGGRDRDGYPRVSADEARRLESLAAGKFLVASPEISDAHFAQTVILLLRYDERSAAGLIINRQTDLPLAEALRGLEEARGSKDYVFAGGPVGLAAALGLVRARSAPAGSSPVMKGCHLISSVDALSRLLGAGMTRDRLRVYLGYAGWAAGQIEREIEMGEWLIFPGHADLVFDPHPETLWARLIGRLEQRLAWKPGRYAALANVLYWHV